MCAKPSQGVLSLKLGAAGPHAQRGILSRVLPGQAADGSGDEGQRRQHVVMRCSGPSPAVGPGSTEAAAPLTRTPAAAQISDHVADALERATPGAGLEAPGFNPFSHAIQLVWLLMQPSSSQLRLAMNQGLGSTSARPARKRRSVPRPLGPSASCHQTLQPLQEWLSQWQPGAHPSFLPHISGSWQ